MTNKEILLEILDRVKKLEDYIKSTAQPSDKIVVSCDGSVIKNPGGPCAVGVVIQTPGQEPIEIGQRVPSKTNNEAEMDAVYVGLNTVLSLKKQVSIPIEVVSDSKVVINGLKTPGSLKAKTLVKKRDLILALVQEAGAEVSYQWKPRNSTVALNKANYLAQKANGVKNMG